MGETHGVKPGKLRILVVAHAFPPMNSTASHRPYSWARSWSDLGHEVHVLTPVKHLFDGAMDLEPDLSGIQVHEIAYLPLSRHAGTAGGAATGRRVEHWEWLKTITRRARFSLGLFGDLRLLSYFPMVRHGLRIVRERGIDLIVATAPPEVEFAVARALSRRTGIPWVADFRDLWFQDMVLYRLRFVSWLLGPVNRWLVKSACALVTVSRGLQERLSGFLGREVIVSYNGFFESGRRSHPPAPAGPDGRFHLVYTGRLYPGKRDPEPLFRALDALRGAMPDLAARISVDFYGFDDPWLRALIGKHRVGDCVRLFGFVPYRTSLEAQIAAGTLLFLDWTDSRAEGVLTGKLFEYLASGRPVLALGARADTEASRLIAEARCGTTLTRHEDIVAYLRNLLSSPRPPGTDFAAVATFSRERQARALLAAITGRLPAKPAAP